MLRYVGAVAVVLGAMVGCTIADTPMVCLLEGEPLDEITTEMNSHLEDCLLRHYDFVETHGIMNPPDEEKSRGNFRKYCNTTSKIEECFEQVTSYATVCLASAPRMFLKYKIYLENWKNGLRVVCSDLGERMAVILSSSRLARVRAEKSCSGIFKESDTNVTDVSASTLNVYHGIQAYKQCVLKLEGGENEELSSIVSSLINDILGELKCAAPDNETMQFCNSINNNASGN